MRLARPRSVSRSWSRASAMAMTLSAAGGGNSPRSIFDRYVGLSPTCAANFRSPSPFSPRRRRTASPNPWRACFLRGMFSTYYTAKRFCQVGAFGASTPVFSFAGCSALEAPGGPETPSSPSAFSCSSKQVTERHSDDPCDLSPSLDRGSRRSPSADDRKRPECGRLGRRGSEGSLRTTFRGPRRNSGSTRNSLLCSCRQRQSIY